MKILLVSDYFYPFTPGGSEWSVYELAKSLKQNKIDSTVATINYGTSAQDLYNGVKIIRIPFPKKLNSQRSVVDPIWQNNPIFWLFSAYYLFRIIKNEKPSTVHVHGKFLIPGSVIASYICRKPVIVTIRDKQILCPIGKCFFDPKRFKACTLAEYFRVDFPWFCKNYIVPGPISILYALAGSFWSKISGIIIKSFAKRASEVTAISISQKRYLEANGFKNVKVIYNTAKFNKPVFSASKNKVVLFVGKLSNGKGVELLLNVAEEILKKQKVEFAFAGSIQSQKIKNRLGDKILKPYIKLLGSVKYEDLPTIYHQVSCLVMPSIYPESFGRAALEALSCGTPLVVTNTGALPEIVEDKITGRISQTDEQSLKDAILDVVNNEEKYRENIKNNYKKMKNKFEIVPIKQYIDLYGRKAE